MPLDNLRDAGIALARRCELARLGLGLGLGLALGLGLGLRLGRPPSSPLPCLLVGLGLRAAVPCRVSCVSARFLSASAVTLITLAERWWDGRRAGAPPTTSSACTQYMQYIMQICSTCRICSICSVARGDGGGVTLATSSSGVHGLAGHEVKLSQHSHTIVTP